MSKNHFMGQLENMIKIPSTFKVDHEEASHWITGQIADHIERKRSQRQIKSEIETELYQPTMERMAEVGLSVENPDFS